MKKTLLSAVSILALSMSAAMAEDGVGGKTSVNANTSVSTTANPAPSNSIISPETKATIKQDWNNTKAAVSEKATQAKDATVEAYQDVKAKLIGESDTPSSYTVSERASASGMIGKPVYNSNHDKVATVSDIIVDKDGRAQMVVVSDGGFAGIGDKLAAFDYGMVVSQNAEGDVFMPLTEDLLSKVAAFSYDPADAGNNVRLIPSDGYSVAQLLKANLEDQNGNKLAKVENITFDNGQADNVIVAFDQMLGLGGDKAAFDFADVQIIEKSTDNVSIRLNANQSAQFETYKKNMTN